MTTNQSSDATKPEKPSEKSKEAERGDFDYLGKITVNTVNGLLLFFLAVVALFCAYAVQFNTFVDIKVSPRMDRNGQNIEPQLFTEDQVVIVDNCDGLSTQDVPAQSVNAASIVVPLRDEVSLPMLSGIGFQGASFNTSADLLGDSHLDHILKQHKQNVTEEYYNTISAVIRPEGARTGASETQARELAKELSSRFPIGETTVPNLEVPPAHLSITTLRWQRKWEQGTAIFNKPALPYFEWAKTEELLEYIIEVNTSLVGIETDQIACDQNLLSRLEELRTKHIKANDGNTVKALNAQILALKPGDERSTMIQDIIEDTSVVGGITTEAHLRDGQDLAIRERPCFPGTEGDPTTNYKGALRENEVIIVLSTPVPDECGYDLEWLYVRTVEGREGYVSSKFIIVPDFEINRLPSAQSVY